MAAYHGSSTNMGHAAAHQHQHHQQQQQQRSAGEVTMSDLGFPPMPDHFDTLDALS